MNDTRAVLNKLAVAVSLIVLHGNALGAEQVSQPVLEEVIITANKRTQNLQDVPLAVTGFGEDFIKEAGLNDLMSVEELTPGFSISTFSLGQPALYIRGIGSNEDGAGGDPSVATYIDDVYIARSSASAFNFINLERIEVLRGPQGTLYGKNAVGGVVKVDTARPGDTFSGVIEASAGEYDLREVRSAVNIPLADKLYSSLAVNYRERDGYVDNKQTGDEFQNIDDVAAQGQILYDAWDNLSINVGLDWEDVDRDGNGRHVPGDGTFGSLHDEGIFTTKTDVPGYQKRKAVGGRVEVNWDGAETRLTSITAYRHNEYKWQEDLFGVSLDLHSEQIVNTTDEDSNQFSQEFRLQSTESVAYSWTAGLYYLWEDIDRMEHYHVDIFSGALSSNEKFEQENTTNSSAAFGEFIKYFNEKFSVTVGLRYTYETKDFANKASTLDSQFHAFLAEDYDIDEDKTWDDLTWNLVAQYQLQDDTMTYAKVSRGFKSGGFQGVPRYGESARIPFDPENAINYELGLKSELFDRRVRLNIAAYYMDYSDLQVTQFEQIGTLPGGTPLASAVVRNAADATTSGVEVEGHWAVTEYLELFGFYAFNDAEYDNYSYDDGVNKVDYSGNSLKNAPRNSYAINTRFHWSLNSRGELAALATFSHRDKTYQSDENHSSNSFKDKDLLNASITWTSPAENIDISVWGQNITDEEYQIHSIANSSGSEASNLYGMPEHYGVSATYRF
jgi:iron complex outermembrane receptor protein